MRKLLTTLAGVALAAGLAAPAGADTAPKPADRPITTDSRHRDGYHRGYYGSDDNEDGGDRQSGRYQGTKAEDPETDRRSPDGDPPGEGRSHYDREAHDDPGVLY
jgi:hypothetical protein